MENISIKKAQVLTAPAPFALLLTKKDDGEPNLMAVSWWTYLSNNPPMLGVCLSKKGYSGRQIEKNKEFSLCLVGENLKEAAMKCGQSTGRTINKAKEYSISLCDAEVINTSLVKDSRVSFECSLVSYHEASDHVFYMANIVAIHGDEEINHLLAWDGYGRLDCI